MGEGPLTRPPPAYHLASATMVKMLIVNVEGVYTTYRDVAGPLQRHQSSWEWSLVNNSGWGAISHGGVYTF